MPKLKKINKQALCKPSVDLGKFLGNLCGDGSIQNTSKYPRMIVYTNTSETAVREFGKNASSLFGVKYRITKYPSNPCWVCYICSTELNREVHAIFDNKCNHYVIGVPKIIRGADKNVKAAFLSHLFADDGSIIPSFKKHSYGGAIAFFSTSKRLVNGVRQILSNDFGIKTKIYVRLANHKHGWAQREFYVLKFFQFEFVEKFYKQIGFPLSYVMGGKRFKGLKKQDVLKNLILKKRKSCDNNCKVCGVSLSDRPSFTRFCPGCYRLWSSASRSYYKFFGNRNLSLADFQKYLKRKKGSGRWGDSEGHSLSGRGLKSGRNNYFLEGVELNG